MLLIYIHFEITNFLLIKEVLNFKDITEIHNTLQTIPISMYIHHQSLIGHNLVTGKYKNIMYSFN